MKENRFKKAFIYGVISSMFFASTFILNRSMDLGGGYWMWSASLRYFTTLIILAFAMMKKKRYKETFQAIRKNPKAWFLWSFVGFGVFYSMSCLASSMAESWFVAAVWQMTIVCGVMLTPLFGKKIPVKNIMFSSIILVGVAALQWSHIQSGEFNGNPLGALIVLFIGAMAYPLGNRKMMVVCPKNLDTMQRIFGMTLCSMPFWILLAIIGYFRAGLPSIGQITQASIVALFAGVIATYLLFEATNLVKDNAKYLAAVEATQAGELIFTLFGGILFLHDSCPSPLGFAGIIVIIVGMMLNSLM